MRGNRLLAALHLSEWKDLAPHLELVPLRAGQLLCDCNHRMHHVYFPTTAVISMISLMDDGTYVELAGIGREGMTGIQVLTGGDLTPYRSQVLYGGYAFRISTKQLKLEFASSEDLRRLLMLYMHALFMQVSQNAACQGRHLSTAQICRWILAGLDCVNSDELEVTQQKIAFMLSIRRETATEVIKKLHEQGIIHHSRGHIKVLDRSRLESMSCECYRVVKKEFGRLFPVQYQETAVS